VRLCCLQEITIFTNTSCGYVTIETSQAELSISLRLQECSVCRVPSLLYPRMCACMYMHLYWECQYIHPVCRLSWRSMTGHKIVHYFSAPCPCKNGLMNNYLHDTCMQIDMLNFTSRPCMNCAASWSTLWFLRRLSVGLCIPIITCAIIMSHTLLTWVESTWQFGWLLCVRSYNE